MSKARILAFSGSTRANSFNQRLVSAAADIARDQGADVTLVTLKDYPMPLFNQDEEAEHGQPTGAAELKTLCRSHDAFLISAPEYNGSITPLLKNTLDWLSRQHGDEPTLAAYQNKTAALLGASGGGLGGMRGLVHVRQILTNLGVTVLPKQYAMGGANEAFDDDGALIRDKDKNAVSAVTERLVDVVSRLGGQA